MAKSAYTDWLGLATTGLEICGNGKGVTNQNLDIPGANGAIISSNKFGTVAAPTCDYKITGSLTSLAFKLGKVHGATGSAAVQGPYALKSIKIHTGAGDEPTFSANGVQIESGATKAVCTFTPSIPALSAARHALTFGAFTYTESAALTLQSSDYTADCDLSPTTIEGVPKASDATKAFEQVDVTMWTESDSTEPTVTVSQGWQLYTDWTCTGSDGALYVWTATFKRFLAADVVNNNANNVVNNNANNDVNNNEN